MEALSRKVLATGIGFFFEYDANKKFDLLNAVNEETLVKVIRNGHVQEIPRKDVVVDDIIILETGEEIPADGQLLEAISLQVNESNLTGDSGGRTRHHARTARGRCHRNRQGSTPKHRRKSGTDPSEYTVDQAREPDR